MMTKIKRIGLFSSLAISLLAQAAFAQPPVPEDQTLTTPFETAIEITLNATGGDGPLQFSIPAQTITGTFQMSGSNTANYTPADDFYGVETLLFEVNDGFTTRTGQIFMTVGNPVATTTLYLVDPNTNQNVLLGSYQGYGNSVVIWQPISVLPPLGLGSGTYTFYFEGTQQGYGGGQNQGQYGGGEVGGPNGPNGGDGGGSSSGNGQHVVDLDPPVLSWISYPGYPNQNPPYQCVSGNISMSLHAIENFSTCPTDSHMQLPQFINPANGQYVSFTPINSTCWDYIYPEYDTHLITNSVGDGDKVFEAFASDIPGNESDHISFTVKVDNTAPVNLDIQFSPALPGSHVIRGAYTLTFTALDATCGMGSMELLAHAGTNVTLGSNTNQNSLVAQWNTANFADGDYTIIGNAIDTVSNDNSLETFNITIDNTPPTLSITNPANNSQVNGLVTISAAASDMHGIDRVEFYVDDHLQGTDTTAPYSQEWDTTQHANTGAVLKAMAYDTVGNMKQVQINVTVNNSDMIPPTVALLSPIPNSHLHNHVMVSGTAADNVAVTLVELLVDSVVKASLSNPPASFQIDWNTANTSDGTRNIQLKAYDANNSTLTNPIQVVVDNAAPSTALITPTNNQHIRGLFTFSASGTDNIGVTQVQFFRDSDISMGLGTPNGNIYSLANFDTAALIDGVHTFYTVAKDAAENTFQSGVINAVVDNTAPTTSIINPLNGSTVNGTITVQADAQDNIGITEVNFYRDSNVFIGQGTYANGHYSAPDLDTLTLSNGPHSFYSVAEDQAGNTATSVLVNVTVDNISSDDVPPSIVITQPLNGQVINGNIQISGTAADNIGLSKIEIFDGPAMVHSITLNGEASTDFSWSYGSPLNGVHTLQAKAYDTATPAANQKMSAPVVVFVEGNGTPSDTEAPQVTITAPTDGANLNGQITIEVSATDNVTVNQIDVYANSVLVERVMTGGGSVHNIQVLWTPTNGDYLLQAKAYDAVPNEGLSNTPLVHVSGNGDPTDTTSPIATIVSPAHDESVNGNVLIQGNVSDNVGVGHVKIFSNGGEIGSFDIIPAQTSYDYNWMWPAPAQGDYTLQVKAYDARPNEGVSALPHLIHVLGGGEPDTTPPSVAVTVPQNGAVINGDMLISGTASDNIGLSKVEIYDGSNMIHEFLLNGETGTNFNWTYPAPPDGPHTIKAKAYDQATPVPNETWSAPVDVTVEGNGSGDVTPPVVNITAPADQAIVRGLVNVSGTASDDVSVTRVEFFVDGLWQFTDNTGPDYGFSLNTDGLTNSGHSLEAKAFDAAENMGTHQIDFTVDNEAPMSSILSPIEGTVVHGLTTISAAASDNQGLNHMEFLVDGNVKATVNGTGPTFVYDWNSGTESDGPHTLQVIAYDNAGNDGQSDIVNVTVDNNDITPPTVSLTAPQNGAYVRAIVTVSATANDNFGVHHVEFFNGIQFLGSDDTAPYSYDWNTSAIPLENADLTAKAFDGALNNTTSSPIDVTVDNVAPQISNFVPAEGAVLSGIQLLQFSALDNAALLRLEIWVNNQLVHYRDYTPGTTSDVLGYSYNTALLPDATYPIEVRAYDQAGGFSSVVHNVQFLNGSGNGNAPFVTIVYPQSDAFVYGYVYVKASITNDPTSYEMRIDGGNPIPGVYNSGTQLYEFGWNTTSYSDGPHSVEVSASNAAGSHAAVIPVQVDNTPPSISWITPDPISPPNPDQLFWTVNLLANVSDNNPTVDFVKFYINVPTEVLASFINNPAIGNFNYLFDTLQEQNGARVYPDGNYTLGVSVKDLAGNVTTAEIPVYIENDDIPTSDGSLEVHPADLSFIDSESESIIWVHPVNATINPQFLGPDTFSVTYWKDGSEHELTGNAQLVGEDVYFTGIVPANSRVSNVSAQFLDTQNRLLATNWTFTRAMDAETGGTVSSVDGRVTINFPASSLPEDAFVDIDIVDPNEMPPAMQEANASGGSNPNTLVWQQPYYATAFNSQNEDVIGLTTGVSATFVFEEQNSQIPDLYQNYIFQPQMLVMGEDPHWKPLTGTDLLGASDEPAVKTISAPIDQMGYFRIAYFPAPAPGISDFFNYPNPFSPHEGGTDITYLLGDDSDVMIVIYDLLGNLVLKVDIPMGAPGGQTGQNLVHWNGNNGVGEAVANGGYIIQITAKSSSGQTYRARHKAAVAK